MTTDLVQQLLDAFLIDTSGKQIRSGLCLKAADAIESLHAENERLAADLANLQVAFNDWKVFHSTVRLEAENERLRDLYRRAISEANGLTNYVEDRPELYSAERRIAKIEEEARAALAKKTTT